MCEIDEKECTIASTGCPVNLYLYDSLGNLVGIKNDELKNEIEGAKFFIEEENIQGVILEDDKDYTFVIEAFDEGSFSFSVSQKRENKDISVYYEKVNITEKSKATFEMKDSEEFKMNVDIDGDGTVDNVLSPDFVDIKENEEEEKNFVKKGTIKTISNGKENGSWSGIIYGIVIILVILIIFLFIKKRNSY